MQISTPSELETFDATSLRRRMAERCMALAASEASPGRADSLRLKAAELFERTQQRKAAPAA